MSTIYTQSERICDAKGNCISSTYNGNPNDPDSFTATYDERENCTSLTYGNNPYNLYSYVATYDSMGKCTSKIYAQDPSDERSWDKRD